MQLTKHRKTTERCAPAHWEEQNALILRIVHECYQVFEGGHGVENHLRYRCVNPETEFAQNKSEGKIDRRARYGFGMPPTDIEMLQGGTALIG